MCLIAALGAELYAVDDAVRQNNWIISERENHKKKRKSAAFRLFVFAGTELGSEGILKKSFKNIFWVYAAKKDQLKGKTEHKWNILFIYFFMELHGKYFHDSWGVCTPHECKLLPAGFCVAFSFILIFSLWIKSF